MWIVVQQTRYLGPDCLQPTSCVGPFDDFRAATLWCDRVGYVYTGPDATARIVALTHVHMHSEDGPPVLVAS